MRLLSIDELANLVGGEYSNSECAGLGFATGMCILSGGPVGCAGAIFLVWQAAEGGCFR